MMSPRPTWLPAYLRAFVLLVSLLAITGCASVRLLSEYDPVIDERVTALQKSLEAFLLGIEEQGREPGPLTPEERSFFQSTRVELSSLAIRAGAVPKNELTVAMIENLRAATADLQELVVEGIAPEQVEPLRSAINTATGAILRLELAKRRGEDAR